MSMDPPNSPSKSSFKSLPDDLKPREELKLRGAGNVSDSGLLAILFRTGTSVSVEGKRRTKNVLELARETLEHFGGLTKLFQCDYLELKQSGIKGLGDVKCIELAAALELGRRIVTRQLTDSPGATLTNPQAVFQLIYPYTQHLSQEVVWVLLLDTRGHLIGQPIECSRGDLNTSPLHPREIFNRAIRCSAAAVILVHNHPTGDSEPSREDIEATRRLIEAGRVVGIPLFDHIVIGRPINGTPGYTSLRARGLVDFTARN